MLKEGKVSNEVPELIDCIKTVTIRGGRGMTNEKTKICVTIGWGGVQNLFIASGEADVFIVDFDTADADGNEVSHVTWGDGTPDSVTEEVFLWKWELGERNRAPKLFLQLEEEYQRRPRWMWGGRPENER